MDSIKILGLVLLIIAMVILGPFITIWALNTLFPILAIGYSIETWAAIILLGGFLRANVTLKK
jgi:hypothetical protein